jgi:hypothetical protein
MVAPDNQAGRRRTGLLKPKGRKNERRASSGKRGVIFPVKPDQPVKPG